MAITTGPWIPIRPPRDPNAWDVVEDDNRHNWICKLPWGADSTDNARLIALAPTMLAALRTISAALRAHQHWKPEMPQTLLDICEPLVAKAEGKS